MKALDWIRTPSDAELLHAWRWNDLAQYNAEVARGLVHTPAWVEKMRLRQQAFEIEQAALQGEAAKATKGKGSFS